jgi:small subunit ribosomal protein S1
VNKYSSRQPVAAQPELDESWWQALLSDEDKYQSPPSAAPENLRPGSKPAVANQPYSEKGNGKGYPAHTLAPTNNIARLTPTETAFISNERPEPGRGLGKTSPVDWQQVEAIYAQDEAIYLNVAGYNRGGLLVEGEFLHGFVPISHLVDIAPETPETDRNALLTRYVGQSLCLKIIECSAERGRIVFSERAALAESGCRNALFDNLKPGDLIWGTATNVTDFGVFLDLGGVEGLIHVSELSWGRVRHPSEVAVVGQSVQAMILSVDKERCRVALSVKRLHSNPWETAEQRYFPGQTMEAVITSIVSFGAFARLEEGLDGLIHVSAFSFNGQPINPSEMVREGQRVQVRVLQVDAVRQRLGLSLCPDGERSPI